MLGDSGGEGPAAPCPAGSGGATRQGLLSCAMVLHVPSLLGNELPAYHGDVGEALACPEPMSPLHCSQPCCRTSDAGACIPSSICLAWKLGGCHERVPRCCSFKPGIGRDAVPSPRSCPRGSSRGYGVKANCWSRVVVGRSRQDRHRSTVATAPKVMGHTPGRTAATDRGGPLRRHRRLWGTRRGGPLRRKGRTAATDPGGSGKLMSRINSASTTLHQRS